MRKKMKMEKESKSNGKMHYQHTMKDGRHRNEESIEQRQNSRKKTTVNVTQKPEI